MDALAKQSGRTTAVFDTAPMPNDVGNPDDGEEVIEVKTATPVPTDNFLSLSGGLSVSAVVAPIVKKRKSTHDVDQVQQAANRP